MHMAIAVRTQLNRTRWKHAFVALVAWMSLLCTASCWSGDEVAGAGRADHPVQRAPMPVASAEGAPEVSQPPPGSPFSALDQAIADDCVRMSEGGLLLSRAWSQHVPDRDCTKDGECGDGFCDRGRCAAIWTCYEPYGQRCDNGQAVRSRWVQHGRCLCLEGRCRSCESDAECAKELRNSSAVCGRSRAKSDLRRCGVLGLDINRQLPGPP